MRYRTLTCVLSLFLLNIAFANLQFLTISDIHYGNKNVSRDGEDTGDDFLKISLNRFRQLSNYVDFILVLGDLPTHSLFYNPEKSIFEETVFHGLYAADHKLKPMFYITGNNDSLTGNYQPFEEEGKSPLNNAKDWTGACVFCDGLIIDASHMRSQGYYSSYVLPNHKEIILIALNTNQFAKIPFLNSPYPNQNTDAQRQLQWLEEQLKALHAKQLLISMHIPPGLTYKNGQFWHQAYLEKFVSLLEQNKESFGQITLLASHTHMDELRRILLKEKNKTIYLYTTPSISRIHYNNPGMKIFTLNDNFLLENYTTYYTTHLEKWDDQHYQALGSSQSIFPDCKIQSLFQCLNQFNKEDLCNYLEQKLFYGVKSNRVPQNVCVNTLDIEVTR